MVRIGKYTGKVYPEDYDFSKCPECCFVVDPSEITESRRLTRYLLECMTCLGCPAANENDLIV